MFTFDPELIPYCTPRQRQLLEQWERSAGKRSAAAVIGCDPRMFTQALTRVKKKAALRGYAPDHDMTRAVPEGFAVKGVSTYYNRDGEAIGQWVKSSSQHEALLEALQDAVDALKEDLAPVPPHKPAQRSGGVAM